MKPTQFISALIITIVITFQAISIQTATSKVSTLTDDLTALKAKIETYIDRMNNNSRGEVKELANRIEELSRENLRLQQENGDLKAQMKAYGSFWKE